MFFTPATIRVHRAYIARARVLVLAAHDPLARVPRGFFTLAGYTYESAGLCHAQFGNCDLPKLNASA